MTKEEFDNIEKDDRVQGWASENLLEYYTDGDDYKRDAKYIKESLFEYMSEEDLKMYNSFPEEITIYRGCDMKELDENHSYYLGQSWTISLEIAKWFAFTIGEDNESRDILEARISKKHILAYTGIRGEYEVIIDESKLRYPKQVTSFNKDEYIKNILGSLQTPPKCPLSRIAEKAKRKQKERFMRQAKKRFKKMQSK